MIDTLKLQIPITINDFEILSRGRVVNIVSTPLVREGYDAKKNCHIKFFEYPLSMLRLFAVYNGGLPHNELYVEFSVPKLLYLNNVQLYYPVDITDLLNNLRDILINKCEVDFPKIDQWSIQRLDLCYAWKFPTQKFAQQVLNSLRGFVFPRKNIANYETSILYKGKTYSVIFYLKQPEFRDMAYKYLAKSHPDLANEILLLSEGVLRFEVQMRKAKIKYMFKDRPGGLQIADLANQELLLRTLNDFFAKLIRSPKLAIDPALIVEQKLITVYRERKAKELLLFWSNYFGSPKQKLMITNTYDRSTINKKLKELSQAGVGVSIEDSPVADLSIPSEIVVNSVNAPFVTTKEHSHDPLQPSLWGSDE